MGSHGARTTGVVGGCCEAADGFGEISVGLKRVSGDGFVKDREILKCSLSSDPAHSTDSRDHSLEIARVVQEIRVDTWRPKRIAGIEIDTSSAVGCDQAVFDSDMTLRGKGLKMGNPLNIWGCQVFLRLEKGSGFTAVGDHHTVSFQ